MKRKSWKRSLSLLLTAILVFSLWMPVMAAEAASPASVKAERGAVTAVEAPAKVSEEVVSQFKEDTYVTYLVKWKEQTDVGKVSQEAYQKAVSAKATPHAQKMAMRNAVVSALRETAIRTQAEVLKYLNLMKKEGKVKEFKNFFIVNGLAVTSTKEVMEELAKRKDIERIDLNHEIAPPEVEKGKEVKGVSPNQVEWNVDKIGAPAVWQMGIDGTGIVVANLDTGVDYTHPALARKWRGLETGPALSWYDAHSHSPLPRDDHGHGTHTMGTMVGSEEDGSNQVGVAPGAKWIAVRIFNPSTTDAIILDGAQWLLAPVDEEGNLHPELAPDVVNNSWGGGPGMDEWFRPMVEAWRAAQIFPEFSAGNDGPGDGTIANPANYPESFATGATDIQDHLASFSSRGPSPYGEMKPEVSAPGVNVRSSVPGGGYEGGWSGTSMAGPHATATAALLLSADPSLTVDQLEYILKSTATPLTDSQYPNSPNNGYGSGLVNALDAVGSVVSGLGTIAGRVTVSGDDFDAPVMEHTPVTHAFTGFDIPLTVHAADNVGVVRVEGFARKVGETYWTYIPFTRTSGDAKDGIYAGTIPYTLVTTAGVEYYLRINDYGNNGFDSETYRVEVSNGVTPGYFQDFENDAAGFEMGGENSTWQWGVPTGGPGAAYSGEKLVATNLSGNYANNSNSYLLMPPIDLTGSGTGVSLSFKHWYSLENNYDYGVVFIASPESGYEFQPVLEFTGDSNGWRNQIIDLSPYAGERVYLLFNLFSDGSVTRPGWYIDDIAVHEPDRTAPGAPADLTATTGPTGNVSLTWRPVSDADLKEYHVYRSTTSGSGYEQIATATDPSYTDGGVVASQTYYYVVTAVDYSGNESGYSNEASVTTPGIQVIYSDGFEGADDNGWTHSGTNDEWQRGTPTSGPGSAYTGEKVWATDLTGNYENGTNAFLYSPVINLSGVTNASLSLMHWYEVERNYDKLFVEITTDGGATWTELARFSDAEAGKTWTNLILDLTPYVGGNVQFRFHITSDSSVVKAGWYLDDFKVLTVSAPSSVAPPKEEKGEAVKKKTEYGKPAFSLTRTEPVKSSPPKAEGEKGVTSLPAGAVVTVLETGRSAHTDPATGRYSLTHVAGDYTLRAESYGYYPAEQSVTVADGGTTTANFQLQPIPHGWISGRITDERTGEAIAGATVLVKEDAHVTPAVTDETGRYTLEVMEGSYTLSVSAADYYGKEQSVTVTGGETLPVDMALKPFVGVPGELGYDDGTAENARAFYDAGNGWAVRMTPPGGAAMVTGGLFRFWDTEWPVPGGTDFQYAIYDASGPDGAPGRLIAGPFQATAKRDGTWTEVTLPTPVMIQGDFYMTYIQTAPYPNSPGLSTDEDGENAGRSWQLVGGGWSLSPADEGNYMIRAKIVNEVTVPIITSPEDHSYTHQPEITVTGATAKGEGISVQLFNGEELAGTAPATEGVFTLPITLHEGENRLTAVAVVNGKNTDPSQPVVVTLDREAPLLTVSTPADGTVTDKEVVYVTGQSSDDHLEGVYVNGTKANLRTNGTFTVRILVDEGENTITVRAVDLAGNETIVTRTVVVDLQIPEITNVEPSQDVHIAAGDPVHVSFDSEPGLHASFRIELPLAPSGRNEISMTETSPGHYEGSYTTPDNLNVEGAVIVVKAVDAAGNVVEAEATGKLYVTAGGGGDEPENQAPIAVIRAISSTKQNKPTTFDASQSRDVDGTIVSYSWDFGDGGTAGGANVSHRFTAPGTYTVTLTVTDNDGATDTVTHIIEVH
ncbi:S8 family serine peptidase [Thermicanus aegyptius]|uniref:S8 family serine peptidase n=1 Tax=Thermicanus aegyptius TaxID=94009 RepID=UPI000423ACC2|nr:S8 family serine peptidase [Thermicanus aegyptius]